MLATRTDPDWQSAKADFGPLLPRFQPPGQQGFGPATILYPFSPTSFSSSWTAAVESGRI